MEVLSLVGTEEILRYTGQAETLVLPLSVSNSAKFVFDLELIHLWKEGVHELKEIGAELLGKYVTGRLGV